MQSERNNNYKKNIIAGLASKVILVIFPFITRTCLIYTLGIEYVGLNGLFSSILQVLSLTELGFGSAMVYSMYKPVSEGDYRKLSALLALYKKVYRIIGSIILGVGLCILPFLKYLVHGDCPEDISLTLLYLIYLLTTVSSYFLFAYRSAVLTAYQKGYITSWIGCGCYSLLYVLQIIALLVTRSYYVYIIGMPVASVLNNILTALVSKKRYPKVQCKGNIEAAEIAGIFKSVYALIWHKIGNTLIYSFDSIVISSFLGLAMLGKYNNYYYVYNAIASIFSILYSGITAGIGDSLVSESKDTVVKQFKLFTFGNMAAVGFCSICLACLYQDFMRIWTGSGNIFSVKTMLLMVLYFYIWHSRRIIHTYKDAAGLWKEDRFRPVVEGIFNLSLNLFLVNLIGINGIIISTIISMLFIGMPWEIKVFIKDYCHISVLAYVGSLIKYTTITVGISLAVYITLQNISADSYAMLAVKGGICAVMSALLFLLVYIKNSDFKHLIRIILKK